MDYKVRESRKVEVGASIMSAAVLEGHDSSVDAVSVKGHGSRIVVKSFVCSSLHMERRH